MKRRVLQLLAPVLVVALASTVYLYERTPAAAMPLRAMPAPWSGNERAIPKLQDMLKQDPSSAEWNTALGHAYLQKARETGDPTLYSRAEELFDRALASRKNYVEALIGRASLALSRHEFAAARDIAIHAVKVNPDVVATYGVLTDAYVELGQYDDAIRTLDRMVHLKPNLSSYSRISYIRELNGDIEGAIQAMRMAIDAGAPDAENTAWCMVQLGNLFLSWGRADADTQYRLALTRFPNYVHGLAGLARVAAARKDHVAAIHFYEKAIAAVPLPEFLIALGEEYERAGRTSDAQRQFALVKEIQKIYRANGVNMDLELVLFNVDHGGDLKQALTAAREEWARRKSVKVADAYAWALYRAGRVEEARIMMKEALRLGTKDPLFLEHARVIQ